MSDVSKVFRCLKPKKPKWLLKREPVVNVDPPDHSDNRGPSSVETTKQEDILPIQAIIEDLTSGLKNTHKREEDIATQSTFEWSDSDIPEFLIVVRAVAKMSMTLKQQSVQASLLTVFVSIVQ